ncbi:hypothetical protein JCM19000A_27200 [Silvimonas sp. JCM 19000]
MSKIAIKIALAAAFMALTGAAQAQITQTSASVNVEWASINVSFAPFSWGDPASVIQTPGAWSLNTQLGYSPTAVAAAADIPITPNTQPFDVIQGPNDSGTALVLSTVGSPETFVINAQSSAGAFLAQTSFSDSLTVPGPGVLTITVPYTLGIQLADAAAGVASHAYTRLSLTHSTDLFGETLPSVQSLQLESSSAGDQQFISDTLTWRLYFSPLDFAQTQTTRFSFEATAWADNILTPVPEPETWLLLGAGVMSMGWRFRGKRSGALA